MSFEVELFRGEDLQPAGSRPFFPIVCEAVGRILNRGVVPRDLELLILQVPQEDDPAGEPMVANLMPDWGYALVRVWDDADRLVYRHPHPIRELVAEPLRRALHCETPEETYWGFRIVGPGLPRTLSRPTPKVDGLVRVESVDLDTAPRIRIRPIEEPPPPVRALADFSIETGTSGNGASPVQVLMRDSVYRQLWREQRFSTELEEGGFLVGHIYRESEDEDAYLTEITGALPAEHAGASLLHFTFTGDSFEVVKRTLRKERRGERLLGWYHTHLFAAREEMGLSSIDLELHFTTFRQPWQLAGLVNLYRGNRTLRFYVRHDDDMVRCPHWVLKTS